MPNIKVYNMQAKEVGEMTLSEEVFGQPLNEALIHQVVVAQAANLRQGTKSALTRSEVRGGGIKPWRQKGTGRARQGSIRSPQWTGGGVVFAPKPRDFSKDLNVKMRRNALKSALSFKAANDELIVLDKIELGEAKTKIVAAMLKDFNIASSVLVVVPEKDEMLLRAGNNIEKLSITTANLLNVTEVVKNIKIVATMDAIKKIEEVCSL
ncbi:MAG: 50S ribosomal protein L4 [Clostridia bacterium]|nr:50S ribosomal protein L4 [Clostridia bacterium]MBR2874268.1 50S ribosomal protein L4 [Clostridia bacterium]MBR6692339.1 50S ribosomal protein L4 [Clostridia bacterium]